jgi:hypothetical protein
MAGTKRHKRHPLERSRVTPEAIAAWQAGDYWGLHAALGLRVWQMPDWGEDPPERPLGLAPGYTQQNCALLQAALLELAGRPPEEWSYDHHVMMAGEPGEVR